MGSVIHENDNYRLDIVVAPKAEYGGIKCYGVVNKVTGVIEGYISHLAHAKRTADFLNAELTNYDSAKADYETLLPDLLAAAKTFKKGGPGELN